jgi:hypothetical protein
MSYPRQVVKWTIGGIPTVGSRYGGSRTRLAAGVIGGNRWRLQGQVQWARRMEGQTMGEVGGLPLSKRAA